jgi:uncharacterized membrane protein
MTQMRTLIATATCAIVLSLSFPSSASAGVKFCNSTSEPLWIAHAVGQTRTNWIGGWIGLNIGSCTTVLLEQSRGFNLYVFARTRNFTVAKSLDLGSHKVELCVKESDFRRSGQWNEFEPPCETGWIKVPFGTKWIRTGETVETISFTD